jgi:hypothetical protein
MFHASFPETSAAFGTKLSILAQGKVPATRFCQFFRSGDAGRCDPAVGPLSDLKESKSDQTGCGNAEEGPSVGIMLDSAESASNAFRFARPRMDSGEQEKDPNHRKNQTPRQKPRNAECGHDFPFLLGGLYLAFELRSQSTNGHAGAGHEKAQPDGADRPSAESLAKQPGRPLVRHLVAVTLAIGARDHTDSDPRKRGIEQCGTGPGEAPKPGRGRLAAVVSIQHCLRRSPCGKAQQTRSYERQKCFSEWLIEKRPKGILAVLGPAGVTNGSKTSQHAHDNEYTPPRGVTDARRQFEPGLLSDLRCPYLCEPLTIPVECGSGLRLYEQLCPMRVVGSPGSVFSPICRVPDGPPLDRRTKKWFEYRRARGRVDRCPRCAGLRHQTSDDRSCFVTKHAPSGRCQRATLLAAGQARSEFVM